jgi:hypothetical protein
VELIGSVVRLQVQRSRLKPGRGRTRVYDPRPLLEVADLTIGPCGVSGDGILDVHHADHPETRNKKLTNGVSLMTVSRYRALRVMFGDHLLDGCAGESLLTDTEHLEDLSGRLVLEGDEGPIALSSEAASPCVEFARFVLGRGPGDVGPEVLAALADLDDGARGYHLQTADSGVVRAGARLFRP